MAYIVENYDQGLKLMETETFKGWDKALIDKGMEDKNGAAENPVCLRCGKCVSVCPMRLQPLYLYRFVNAQKLDELNRLNLMDCMECGSCAYTCPGKLPLVHRFRVGKKLLKEAAKK